jgi:hypothetical protein
LLAATSIDSRVSNFARAIGLGRWEESRDAGELCRVVSGEDNGCEGTLSSFDANF